jgi:hypothetical protein
MRKAIRSSMIVEERNVEVGGLPIRYLTAGTGPPLVLLHRLKEKHPIGYDRMKAERDGELFE